MWTKNRTCCTRYSPSEKDTLGAYTIAHNEYKCISSIFIGVCRRIMLSEVGNVPFCESEYAWAGLSTVSFPSTSLTSSSFVYSLDRASAAHSVLFVRIIHDDINRFIYYFTILFHSLPNGAIWSTCRHTVLAVSHWAVSVLNAYSRAPKIPFHMWVKFTHNLANISFTHKSREHHQNTDSPIFRRNDFMNKWIQSSIEWKVSYCFGQAKSTFQAGKTRWSHFCGRANGSYQSIAYSR